MLAPMAYRRAAAMATVAAAGAASALWRRATTGGGLVPGQDTPMHEKDLPENVKQDFRQVCTAAAAGGHQRLPLPSHGAAAHFYAADDPAPQPPCTAACLLPGNAAEASSLTQQMLPLANTRCWLSQVSEHFPDEPTAEAAGGSGGSTSTAGSGQPREHPDEMSDPYSGADPYQKQGGGGSK